MISLDWQGIDLVVFDVDGTLYDQRRLRLRDLRAALPCPLVTTAGARRDGSVGRS